MMKRVSLTGVIAGGVVDIVATNVLAFPVLIVAATKVDVRHLPKEAQGHALLQAVQTTPSLFVTQLLLGIGASVLGGYVAARIPKHDEILNGALSAFLCLGFGVYAVVTKSDSYSSWAHIAGFTASPLCGALGGYLAARMRRSVSPPTPAPSAA